MSKVIESGQDSIEWTASHESLVIRNPGGRRGDIYLDEGQRRELAAQLLEGGCGCVAALEAMFDQCGFDWGRREERAVRGVIEALKALGKG